MTAAMNSERRQSILFNHWQDLSTKYSQISPILSSFYMNQLLEATDARESLEEKITTNVCPYCGVLRTTNNSRTRLRPRIKKTKCMLRMKDKLRIKATNIHKNQTRILQLMESNCNQMVISCYNCKKKCHLRLNVPEDSSSNSVLAFEKPKKRRKKKELTAGLTIPTTLNTIAQKKLLQTTEKITKIKVKATENTTVKTKTTENTKVRTNTARNSRVKMKTTGNLIMKYSRPATIMKTHIPVISKKELKKPNADSVPTQRQKLESFLSNLFLKTSFLKWKPDYDGAASEYTKAATNFKNGKALQQSKDCLLRASECYRLNQSCMEQAAFVSKDMGDYLEAANLVEKACRSFQEHGVPDTAALALDKGAKIIESKHPERALQLYLRAAEVASLEDRPRQVAEYLSKATRLLLKLKRLDEASDIMRQEMDMHMQAGSNGAVSRMVVALVIVDLTRGDYVAAEKIFRENASYVEADEAQTLIALLDAFDQEDSEAAAIALKSPFLKHMDVEYAKLARDLYIPSNPLYTAEARSRKAPAAENFVQDASLDEPSLSEKSKTRNLSDEIGSLTITPEEKPPEPKPRPPLKPSLTIDAGDEYSDGLWFYAPLNKKENNSENPSNTNNYSNLTFKTKEDNGWVVVSGKKKRRKPSNEFNDFMDLALEDVPPAHTLDAGSDFEMDCELNLSPVVSPPPETVPSTPPTPSSLTHMEPEGSWYVTPPPCFTAVGHVSDTTPVLSPMENLLIEHPSMSVYQSSQTDSQDDVLDAPPLVAPASIKNKPPSGNVKAGAAKKVQIIQDAPQEMTLRERSQVLLIQVLKQEQMMSESFGRCPNIETIKNLCRNRLARNNKIREFASAGRHKSRKDRMRSPSGANNNRKC
uniref:Gamma-soluble NSF attachment protein n=1 Tax=Strigamia maritima TaxID=126957 RepID=T1J298_STRMM